MDRLRISTLFTSLLLLGGTAYAQQGAPGAPPTPYPGAPPPPPIAEPVPQPVPAPYPAPAEAEAPVPTAQPGPTTGAPPPPPYPQPAPTPAQSGYPPQAQPYPPQQGYAPPTFVPPPASGSRYRERQGWVFGLSLGAGALSGGNDDESVSGVAFSAHVGFMLGPQFALQAEGFSVSHFEGDRGFTQTIGLVSGQFWVNPALWVKGGLGTGHLSLQDNGRTIGQSEDGVAGMLAIGYEFVRSDTFAVDLQLRGGAVSYETGDSITQTSVGVGVNWY